MVARNAGVIDEAAPRDINRRRQGKIHQHEGLRDMQIALVAVRIAVYSRTFIGGT